MDEQSILLWQEDDVHAFLASLGFKGYEQQIKENGITGEILVHLDHQGLKDVGIHSVGHRLAILKAVYTAKLQHDVPVEEDHWVPPSGFMDQIMVDSPSGVIPPDRMFELLRERDERIRILEESISRLQEHVSGMRDEVHVISKTLYTKEPPVSLNKLRAQSPTTANFISSSLRHMRSGSLPRDNLNVANGDAVSPSGSPANSPTRLLHARDDGSSHAPSGLVNGSSGLHHSSSIRRQRSNHGLLNAASALQDATTAPATSSDVLATSPGSPLSKGMFMPSKATLEPNTPTAFNMPHTAATTPNLEMSAPPLDSAPLYNNNSASESASGSQILSEALGRPSTMQNQTSGSRETSKSSSGRPSTSAADGSGAVEKSSSSSKNVDNPYKSFKVTVDDPCYKVLPAALKRYKINDDWRQYALFICYGSQGERCVFYDEKPLILFQKLKDTNQNPVFMLRHIKDIKSPIAAAQAKHILRKDKRLKEGKNITGEGKEGPKREFSRATRLHHPAVLQPVKGGPNSPAPSKDREADSKDSKADGKDSPSTTAGYALAIYPYMADREDEFDVSVGDTFVILNKTKGWWVVHRDTKANSENDVVRSGWVPQGCLLETSGPPFKGAATPITSATPINPLTIVSVSTPGLSLMDHTPRGPEEINMKKEDRLRVFKRYNNWSYVIKEVTGERGWAPSWFIGKVPGGSSQSTPTSAAAAGPLTAGIPPPSASGSLNTTSGGFDTGEVTPTSANHAANTSGYEV